MSISQRLIQIRKRYDCTQAEFGKMLGTNGQSIADVETGKKKIGINLLENLHKTLSINLPLRAPYFCNNFFTGRRIR